MPLFGFICLICLICAFFRAIRLLIVGPYETAKHPERSTRDAVAAWKMRSYDSPKKAEWALDNAMEWAKDFTAPTKREAYKALDARLDYYLR